MQKKNWEKNSGGWIFRFLLSNFLLDLFGHLNQDRRKLLSQIYCGTKKWTRNISLWDRKKIFQFLEIFVKLRNSFNTAFLCFQFLWKIIIVIFFLRFLKENKNNFFFLIFLSEFIQAVEILLFFVQTPIRESRLVNELNSPKQAEAFPSLHQ